MTRFEKALHQPEMCEVVVSFVKACWAVKGFNKDKKPHEKRKPNIKNYHFQIKTKTVLELACSYSIFLCLTLSSSIQHTNTTYYCAQ